MIKWIKDISNELLIAFIPPLCVALILTLPTYLVGWYRGYDKAERLYKPDIEKIQDLRKRYYEASNKLKDAMTEILKYKLELQEKEGGK